MTQDVSSLLKKLSLPSVDQNKIEAFIERWQNTSGSGAELADFQSFITELCDALEVTRPDPKSDASKDNGYIFERPVDIFDATGACKPGKNRIDLYRRDCFVMEGKQTGKKIGSQGWYNAMQKAKHQADEYVRSLPANEGRPPFILLVDVGRSIQLYAEFSRSGGIYVPFPDPGHYTIELKDLRNTDIQQRLQSLWLVPDSLDPSKYAAQVTQEVSSSLAALAKSLEEAGYEVERTAHFLKRCLFTMFSEDVELIPERSFTQLLEKLKARPENFTHAMKNLWDTMNTGGYEGQLGELLPRFNGGLFKNIDPIPLNAEQIQLLIDAAHADWRFVEPAIFGTLLERALNPRERHKLGAHYTPRAYVERLVMPALIEPLRNEWNTVKIEVEMQLQANKEDKALDRLRQYHYRLCNVRVLDPACGSANFLYVALEHLKRLEGEVLNRISDLNAGQTMLDTEGLTVDPHQFLGLEINPRAAAIAEIVLWIGYLQWHYRIHGKLNLPEPILRDFDNIENRDALIDYDSREQLLDDDSNPITIWDGVSFKTSPATGELIPDETQRTPVYHYNNPTKAQWPEADYIIGNPPFIGASTMRRALGDGYVDAVRDVYKGIVPDSADFVMYWWNIAAEKTRTKKDPTQRFGFITTNSLRQTFNRRVLEPHLNDSKKPLSLMFAIPDHPWVDGNDGAAVRIAMTVGSTDLQDGKLQNIVSENISDDNTSSINLNFRLGKIFSDLNIGADINSSIALCSNLELSSRGVMLFGSGFIVSPENIAFLVGPSNEGLPSVVRNYRNGRDITQTARGVRVVDLFGYSCDEVKRQYPNVYQWILERVKPERDVNRDKSIRENWWLHGRPRPEWRKYCIGLPRYIATVETAKHRLFTFLDSDILPDNKLINIALDNASYYGILTSRLHILWSMRAGSRLGVGNDLVYVKTTCFETFPFPVLDTPIGNRLRSLAEQIDSHRKRQQAEHPKLTLTNIYNVLEKLRREEPLSKKEQEVNQQGLVSILRQLHDDLDRASFEAYGWNDLADKLVGLPGATTPLPDKSDAQAEVEEELLQRLVELNHQRAAEESTGQVRWLRPNYQAPDTEQTNIAITTTEAEKVKTSDTLTKASWPKDMVDQISAVLEWLTKGGVSDEQLASYFKRKPLKGIRAVLEALRALGRAECIDGIWQAI